MLVAHRAGANRLQNKQKKQMLDSREAKIPQKEEDLYQWGSEHAKAGDQCFSLVSPLDTCPDPKCKPYINMKNHHDRLFVVNLLATQNSLEFFQTANGCVLCCDKSSGRVHHQDHRHQGWIRKVRETKAWKKNRQKSRRDQEKPRETAGHEVKQETLETKQLWEKSQAQLRS